MSVNFRKSKYFLSEISFLGHIVSGGEIKVNPKLKEPVKNFPVSRTRRQLRRFFGLAGWRRMYIENFSCFSEPIVALLRKEVNFFEFCTSVLNAFERIKEALVSPPALTQNDINKELQIFRRLRDIFGWLFGAS